MGDQDFARLVEEIKEVGFILPILVVPTDGGRFKILNGEHRWKAATTLGYEYVPSVILSDEKWNDQDVFQLVNIRLNEIRGRLSSTKLQPIYDKVAQKYGEDNVRKMMGITQDDVYKKLIKKMATSYKKSVTSELAQEQIDEAAKIHKNPKSFTRSVSKIIRDEAEKAHQVKCLIFQSNGKEHVVVKCSDHLFAAISEIVRQCQNHGKDINDVLFGSFSEVLQKSNEIFPDKSIDLPQ